MAIARTDEIVQLNTRNVQNAFRLLDVESGFWMTMNGMLKDRRR
jgi:hypothetical protein